MDLDTVTVGTVIGCLIDENKRAGLSFVSNRGSEAATFLFAGQFPAIPVIC